MKQNHLSQFMASNAWVQRLSGQSVIIQQRLSLVCCVTLLMSAAWVVGQLFWLMQNSAEAVTPWRAQAVSSQHQSQSSLDTSTLKNSHLFGVYQQDAKKVEAPVVQDAPKTRLNLTLVGVVASSDDTKSLAVIANRGSQSTYGINEQIEGTRAQLKAVFSDRVIIDNSGRDETLMLAGIDYSKLSANAPAVTKPAQNRHGNNSANNNASNSAAKLESIRTEIAEDPQKVFQYVRMSQVKRDGNVLGYRVTPGKEPELFRSVGLESGDIAVQLNGQDLTDPAAMSNIFKSISELSELSLTVERDGQNHDINIEF